jgi:AcrR family transcriptional regulator
MVAVANRDGYAAASVSEVIAQAKVSRPTFYDYFADRDACFVAAIAAVHARLDERVRGTIAAGAPRHALTGAIAATVAFAGEHPPEARFLMKEALAGGPAALAERDRGLAASARLVEAAFKRVDEDEEIPDLPVAAALGAVQRVLASRLRRGEVAFGGLAHDLGAWVESYAQPAGSRHWRTLKGRAAPARSPYLPPTALRAPAKLGPGRPRIAPEAIAENQRQRIMFATAELVQRHGYNGATVAEIMRLAGVEGRTFYRLFADKEEAFSAMHEHGFQYLMAATAGAFFAGESWPERVWEAFRATVQSIDELPAFANVAFVEAYAVGPRAIQRVEDSRAAFAIFLQEGYRHQPEDREPPTPAALEAVIATIFEIVYVQTRARGRPKMAGLLALLVHLCLAPFLGARASDALIDAQLARLT